MIETPSAAILVGQLADEVDFLSVGTNDLVQFLLAADRIRGEMASTYDPPASGGHPGAGDAGERGQEQGQTDLPVRRNRQRPPAYTNLLIGLGFRSFSVAAGRLLEIKHAIRSTSLQDAERLAGQVLPLSSTRDIRARVQDDWNRRRPVSSPEIVPRCSYVARFSERHPEFADLVDRRDGDLN
jgi:signal transduction protein with GAF and PtsI domain